MESTPKPQAGGQPVAAQNAAAPPLSRRAAKRARLARLREETEPLVAEERRLALRALLQHPLLIPDGPRADDYALVRRHREWLADWFAHHADWPLVVTPEAARLRKFSTLTTDATRPALEPRNAEPCTRARYTLLCLALSILERGDRQITLKRLSDHLLTALAADPAYAAAGILWTLDTPAGRRDYVHILRILVALGILRRVQGTEENLIHQRETDALYNISRPTLALILAARRSPSHIADETLEERLHALVDPARPDTPEARNRAHRTTIIARLLDDPVLYYATLTEDEKNYLDYQRPSILAELAEATALHPEVRAEGLALCDLDGDCTDAGLPEEGTEGHLTLLLATWLADRLRHGDPAPVPIETIRQKTIHLICRHRHHWRKEVTQRGAEIPLTGLVIDRLAGLSLIERITDQPRETASGAEAPVSLVRPLPALGRFALRDTPGLAPATGDTAPADDSAPVLNTNEQLPV
jgi:uncharacterized protein (TIGR02678 family)